MWAPNVGRCSRHREPAGERRLQFARQTDHSPPLVLALGLAGSTRLSLLISGFFLISFLNKSGWGERPVFEKVPSFLGLMSLCTPAHTLLCIRAFSSSLLTAHPEMVSLFLMTRK